MQPPQHRDLAGERLDLVLDQPRGRVALALADRAARRQPRERLDLLEAEAEILERERGRDVAAVLARVLPGAARRAPRLGQDAQLLVVADGAAADAGRLRQLADADQARGVVADFRHERRLPPSGALGAIVTNVSSWLWSDAVRD